jgi:hypothetical protein
MNKIIRSVQKPPFTPILVIFSLLVYFSIIWIAPFIKVAGGLARYSALLFLVVFILYTLTFFIEGKTGLMLSLTLTLAICALTLLDKWASGFSDNMLVGGLLPYKDAKYYYHGAQMVLDGFPIAQTSVQAAGRPLFPGFLAMFLRLTWNNLPWALALIFACAGVSAYLAARRVYREYGVVPGALLATFLALYLRPFIGFTLSESAGFIFGCLAFVVIWQAARKLNQLELVVGLAVLTLAVSIRTGAFFMLPSLILWAGWAFRGENRFSYKVAGVAALTVTTAFAMMNVIYPRLVVEPGGVTFGNFAYALYGQVHGGTGWHYAIKVMGTQDPEPILQAAIQFFFQHPLSFFIGAAKAYRDFFFTDIGLFEFMTHPADGFVDSILWTAKLLLLGAGIVQVCRNSSKPVPSFLLASFLGVLISIPFLPPIDGGSRFYASSIPFLFALAAIGPAKKFKEASPAGNERNISLMAGVSLIVVLCAVCVPVILQRVSRQPMAVETPVCENDTEPFVARMGQASFIDLVRSGKCGRAPQICLADFIENGTEPITDDFYQELITQANTYNQAMRTAVVTNLLDDEYYYLIGSPEQIEVSSNNQLITGCATHIRTSKQNIYKIQDSSFP